MGQCLAPCMLSEPPTLANTTGMLRDNIKELRERIVENEAESSSASVKGAAAVRRGEISVASRLATEKILLDKTIQRSRVSLLGLQRQQQALETALEGRQMAVVATRTAGFLRIERKKFSMEKVSKQLDELDDELRETDVLADEVEGAVLNGLGSEVVIDPDDLRGIFGMELAAHEISSPPAQIRVPSMIRPSPVPPMTRAQAVVAGLTVPRHTPHATTPDLTYS